MVQSFTDDCLQFMDHDRLDYKTLLSSILKSCLSICFLGSEKQGYQLKFLNTYGQSRQVQEFSISISSSQIVQGSADPNDWY